MTSGNHSDEYPTWQLLAAIRCLSPEAEAAASFKTICLSFTANWFVLGMEVSGNALGRICILTDALHENVYHTQKRAGPWAEDAFGAPRQISRLCDALSCLNKAAGSLMAKRLSNFYSSNLVCFSCASKYIKLSLFLSLCVSPSLSRTTLLPSGSSFPKPALFIVFRDSCQNAEGINKRKLPPCLYDTAWNCLENTFPSTLVKYPKHWNQ